MTVREIVDDVMDQLPPDATLNDVVSQLCLRMKVQKAIKDVDDGRGVPHEEAKKQLAEWLE